ncbi:MAG TPA: lantibiotic dehydratase, partial [Arachidicoccus sp.]
MKETLFISHEKVIVRTPLYSYAALFDTDNTTRSLNETIKALLNDAVFLEGIYWSSPALYQNVLDYKKGCYNPNKEYKLLLTLKKYAIRACTRCTPYGIFAGCGITGITEKIYSYEAAPQRKARIDMGLLQQIRAAIESDEEIWRYLHYQINDTLYSLPGQYRFIESIVETGKYNYQVSSIEQTDLLQTIAEDEKTNTFSLDFIFNLLKNDYSNEEISSYIQNLIETQFLVSEVQLSLTVED